MLADNSRQWFRSPPLVQGDGLDTMITTITMIISDVEARFRQHDLNIPSTILRSNLATVLLVFLRFENMDENNSKRARHLCA